ncbi:hypothetical protein HRS9139_02467 [Pyrenophora teres f. teres]|nr:hypothetical protein HRS9139_02467 [Pyrenophora teres f. teres]
MPPPWPPPPANATNTINNTSYAANTQWMAFCRQHDEELKRFHQDVLDNRAKFEEEVQSCRMALLQKHKREEEEFWRGSASARTIVTDKKVPVNCINLISDDEEDDEDELVETQNLNNLSALSSTQNTNKPAAPTMSTKPTTQSSNADTPVIKPEESTSFIPSATLELFGNKPKTFGEIVPFEREISTMPLETAPIQQVNSSANASRERSFQTQAGGRTFGAPAASFTFNVPLGNSMFGSSFPGSQVFSRSGLTGTASRPRFLSGSTWDAPKIPENQGFGFQRGLFTRASPAPLPQQHPVGQPAQSTVPEKLSYSGLALKCSRVNIPYQAQVSTEEEEESLFISERSSVDRRDDLEVIGEGVVMAKAPRIPNAPKPQQHVPNIIPSPCPTEPSTPVTPSTPKFRKPIFPASATKDAISAFKNVRASSRASTSAIPAPGPRRSERGTSVFYRGSSSLRTTTIRKRNRKVVNLSSDEDESDYAPDPSDDEAEDLELPLEVGQKPKAQKIKMRKIQSGPTSKKAKTEANPGKNPFGFHNSQIVRPKRKLLMKPSPRTTLPPSPKEPMSAYKQTKKSPRLRSHRPSKLAAVSRISQQFALHTEYLAAETVASEDCAIEEVRGGLRSMSLTPALSDTTTEDVEALAETRVTVTGGRGKALRSGCMGPKGWVTWMERRQTRDRYLASIGEGGDGDKYRDRYGEEGEVEGYDIKEDELWKARKLKE